MKTEKHAVTRRKSKSAGMAESVYVYSVVIAFGLLFFANAEHIENPDGLSVQLGIGKAFYLPCGMALLSSFYLNRWNRHDRLIGVLNWMLTVAIVSSLIHPPMTQNIMAWALTRFVFAILCFRDIRRVDPVKLVTVMARFSPFIVYLHYVMLNPFSWGGWRYGGFYGDPNFLAMALNLIIAVCYMAIRHEHHVFWKCSYIAAIIGAIPLIMLGVSRGGILGTILLLSVMAANLWKTNKRSFALLSVVIVLSSTPFVAKMGDTIDNIEYRFFGGSQADAIGAMARWEGVQSALIVFANRPELIPFGIGLGNTEPQMEYYERYGYYCKYAIHNTFFQLMYEAGIIEMLLYIYLYLYAFKSLWRHRNYLLMGLLLSAMISLMTLPGIAFMPAWILLFFVTNKRLSNVP